MFRTALIVGLAALSLAACAKRTRPPGEAGACYHAVKQKDGTIKFNRLPGTKPNLETCAANLEAMRIKFLRMGGSNQEITGAFQGTWIFIQKEGIFASPSLEQAPYLALVRTGDGRLAIPGAMPQQ